MYSGVAPTRIVRTKRIVITTQFLRSGAGREHPCTSPMKLRFPKRVQLSVTLRECQEDPAPYSHEQ